MKFFTLEEAQLLLPILNSLLARAVAGKREAERLEDELGQLRQRIFLAGGMSVDLAFVARNRSEFKAELGKAKDAAAEIDAIGVHVKDLDTGLLDFPCRVDGEVVLLCWKMGEPRIEFWHTQEAGFGGRQPLDERFTKSRGERPN